MKIINLSKKSKLKIDREIQLICGNSINRKLLLFTLKSGLARLTFIDPERTGQENIFNTAIVFFENGLGIYFRNTFENYLVLVPTSEITCIEYHFTPVELRASKYSIYSLMIRLGIKQHLASKFLMPNEVINPYVSTLTLKTNEKYFIFEVNAHSPEKIKDVFKNSKFEPFFILLDDHR